MRKTTLTKLRKRKSCSSWTSLGLVLIVYMIGYSGLWIIQNWNVATSQKVVPCENILTEDGERFCDIIN